VVSGLTHNLPCTDDELRKLLSKQDEDNAAGGELNKVPNRGATNPGDGKCLAALFDIAPPTLAQAGQPPSRRPSAAP